MSEERKTRTSRGILYVSPIEFADRVGVTPDRIRKMQGKGGMPFRLFPGYKTKYIPWEEGKAAWDARPKPAQKTKRTIGERRSGGYDLSTLQVPVEPVRPVESSEDKGIADVAEHEDIAAVDMGGRTYNLTSLDPVAFSDCWIRDKSGWAVTNPETGEHLYNWDLVDKKLKALIHDQQYQERQGQLIPREEVDYILSTIFLPLTSQIAAIPNQFASRTIALVEDRFGAAPPELKTELAAVMKSTVKRILASFQEAVSKAVDDDAMKGLDNPEATE